MKNTKTTIFAICIFGWTCSFAQIGQQKREWVKVDDDTNMVANFYIDPKSIVIKNDVRRVFSMTDLKISSSGPSSTKSRFMEILFKCNPENSRKAYTSYMESYSGQMLTGKLLDGGRAPAELYEELIGSEVYIADVVCAK